MNPNFIKIHHTAFLQCLVTDLANRDFEKISELYIKDTNEIAFVNANEILYFKKFLFPDSKNLYVWAIELKNQYTFMLTGKQFDLFYKNL